MDNPFEDVQRGFRTTALRASRTSLVAQWYIFAKLPMGKVSLITIAMSAKKAPVKGHSARIEGTAVKGLQVMSAFGFLRCGSLEEARSTDLARLLLRREEIAGVWVVTGFILKSASPGLVGQRPQTRVEHI
jgi:hypothetical protein